MKTIGLLGGMSWESTVTYYQEINRLVAKELGSFHSAKIAMFSVDFQEIETLQVKGEWTRAGELLAGEAKKVEKAGADFMLICTNTMHKVYEEIKDTLSIPVLHIADATGFKLKKDGVNKVGLLGTGFTMEQDFYKKRIEDKYGIQVIVPGKEGRELVHEVIYQELCKGVISEESKQTYLSIVEELSLNGAQGVILGCTEIGLLIKPEDTDIPLFDTGKIHSEAAVSLALAGK